MNSTTVQLNSIPKCLTQWSHWVCWRYARPSDGSTHRWCKLPVSAFTGRNARTTCPTTWSDFETAMTSFKRNQSSLAGVGFVFSEDDPFVGIDMDKCRNEESGELSPWAQTLVDELDSYTEVSPSGTGVKCIVQSTARIESRRKSSPGIEIYSADRFFTITGQRVGSQHTVNDRTEQLQESHARLFPPAHCEAHPPDQLHRPASPIPDEMVLQRAMNAKNGWKCKRLWNGDLSLHSENASEADLGLCRILAFWTGPYPTQIDRLFRMSHLFRPKWDESHYANGNTYGQETVHRAITAQRDTFFQWPTSMRQEIATAIT